MKKFLMLIAVFILCISLCSCTQEEINFKTNAGFIAITGEDNLFYDGDTKIVYIVYRERAGNGGYGFMSPYYAPNGLPYRYDANNQTLIEIDGGGING